MQWNCSAATGARSAFYRDVAGRAPMATPQVYAARIASNSADFVLLLEDLGDWDNADHLAGLSMDRARLCIAAAGRAARVVDRAGECRCLEAFPSLDTPIDARSPAARVRTGLADLSRQVRSNRCPPSVATVRGAVRRTPRWRRCPR